jgi:hypothetical protein
MNYLKHTSFILIMSLFVAAAGCRKPDDTRPDMNVITPSKNQTYVAGNEIEFHAVFTDNKELAEYKIDIHDNFDGHQHNVQSQAWQEVIIGELSGKEETVKRNIVIPSSATPGPYHFDVKCIDKAGNESRYLSIEIIIIGKS